MSDARMTLANFPRGLAAALCALLASVTTGCAASERSLTDLGGAYGATYAVVVSKQTAGDAEWAKVVEALRVKHNATVVTYDADAGAGAAPPALASNRTKEERALEPARARLAELMPAYTAFVAKPSECGRDFVAAVHRLTRRLDDDPWLDTRWGIITGADAAAALRLAKAVEPLEIKTALATTNLNDKLFDEYFLLSDGDPGGWHWKKRDGEILRGKDDFGKPDAEAWADHFARSPDLIVTSFHGFENGVEVPFSRGILRVWNGKIYPLKSPRVFAPPPGTKPLPDSPNPKVYFPVGNCLVGHVNSADCMVTAMTGRYGVNQMAAYTVNTWFGRGGWGMLGYWQTLPGRNTFTDAFFFNQQQMLHDIAAIDPKGLDYRIPLGPGEIDPRTHFFAMMRARLKFDPRSIRGGSGAKTDRELAGLLWDIDTVAFYGDPAWKATLDYKKDPAFLRTLLTSDGNEHELRVTLLDAPRARQNGTPIGIIFTTRLKNVRVTAGEDYKPIVADNFILLLNPRPKGDETELVIRFTGERVK